MSLRILNFLVISVLAILALSIFAGSMIKPLSHDEQMFTTAGVLVWQGKMMYRDFSYPGHLPYHSLILAALFKILNTSHYLLTGRILSCVCDIVTMLCIVAIYRKILKPYPILASILALAAAVLYVFNPAVQFASGYSWNHNVTIACVAVSAIFFIFMEKPDFLYIAAISGLLTFASGIRITSALAEVCFFIMILLLPTDSMKQKVRNIFTFLLTAAIVLIYPVYIIAQAPQSFLLNLFKIPALNGQWQQMINTYISNPNIASPSMMLTDYAFILIITIVLGIALIYKRHHIKVTNPLWPLLSVMLVVAFFVIALVPPTTWKQYLALPVPFILIAFAFPVLYLRNLAGNVKDIKIIVTVFMICSAWTVLFNVSHLQKIFFISKPQTWTAIQLHTVAQDIAKNTVQPKKILTLGPLYALEGGCDIYDQLSAGPFAYRVAEGLSKEERTVTNTIAADQLKELVVTFPPCAVVLGAEFPPLEQPLFDAAVKLDWQKKVYENGITAYFLP